MIAAQGSYRLQPAQSETIPAKEPLRVIRKLHGPLKPLLRNNTDKPPAAAPENIAGLRRFG